MQHDTGEAALIQRSGFGFVIYDLGKIVSPRPPISTDLKRGLCI